MRDVRIRLFFKPLFLEAFSFVKKWHIVYEKITKKEVKKMINSFIYSFIYLIRFLCEIIITLAAVKYLMPEIRKICRMIAGSEEKAQQKEAPGQVKRPVAEQPKKAVRPEAKQGSTVQTKKPVNQQHVAEKMKTTAERKAEENLKLRWNFRSGRKNNGR